MGKPGQHLGQQGFWWDRADRRVHQARQRRFRHLAKQGALRDQAQIVPVLYQRQVAVVVQAEDLHQIGGLGGGVHSDKVARHDAGGCQGAKGLHTLGGSDQARQILDPQICTHPQPIQCCGQGKGAGCQPLCCIGRCGGRGVGQAERIMPPGGAVPDHAKHDERRSARKDRLQGKAEVGRCEDGGDGHRPARRVQRAGQGHCGHGQQDGQRGSGHDWQADLQHGQRDKGRDGVADHGGPRLGQRAVWHDKDQKRGRAERGDQQQSGFDRGCAP